MAEGEVAQTRSKSLEDDEVKIAEYLERCKNIKDLIVKNNYDLECFTNYHHYGPSENKARVTSAIKIANFNLLHPGTSKTLFKDYALTAKIMNRFDVVSGLELLATVGRDEQNNKAVLAFLENGPSSLEKLRLERAKLKDPTKIQAMNERITKLDDDLKKASNLFRSPGYLVVLDELKKLDPSWSLILSPRGDSALIGSVEEMVGFYYRSSLLTPVINPHCKEYQSEGAGTPYACFITLTKDFMGKDFVQHFARRPFMASFKAGGEKFTLISSHMVFTYSGDEEDTKDFMLKVFGVENYKEIGPGVNAATFARFAEVKITLDFMNRYKKNYHDDRILFMADTNLNSNNAFWPEVLKIFPGSELLINTPTTVSPPRYLANGKETNGIANDYDHFVINRATFNNCSAGEVYNFYNEGIYSDIEKRYIIRKEIVGVRNKELNIEDSVTDLLGLDNNPTPPVVLNEGDDSSVLEGDIPPTDDPATVKLDYPLTPAGQSKMDKFANNFEKQLKGLFTIKRNEVVPDDFQITERIEALKRRVFLRQLTNPYYFRYMQEVISDHFPVSITCKM